MQGEDAFEGPKGAHTVPAYIPVGRKACSNTSFGFMEKVGNAKGEVNAEKVANFCKGRQVGEYLLSLIAAACCCPTHRSCFMHAALSSHRSCLPHAVFHCSCLLHAAVSLQLPHSMQLAAFTLPHCSYLLHAASLNAATSCTLPHSMQLAVFTLPHCSLKEKLNYKEWNQSVSDTWV